jgi:hypothetical protein
MARAAMGSAGGPVLPEGGGPRCLIIGKTIESVPPSLYHAAVNCRRGKLGNIALAVRAHTGRNFSAAPAPPAPPIKLDVPRVTACTCHASRLYSAGDDWESIARE